jgi:hypothetical protein
MKEYDVDRKLRRFIKKFSEPHNCIKADQEVIKEYSGKLPAKLFEYWRELGWCGYGNGLIWMVNPKDYEDILEQRLRGTPFEDRDDLSVIARNAFGELYVWAKGKGKVLAIRPSTNVINYFSPTDRENLSEDEENRKLQRFWSGQQKQFLDIDDEEDKPLFDRCLEKFGPLKPDEMYGFKQHLAVGGARELKNMEILKLDVYHSIAAQLDKPDTSMGISGLL